MSAAYVRRYYGVDFGERHTSRVHAKEARREVVTDSEITR